jgi:hypothetical protein
MFSIPVEYFEENQYYVNNNYTIQSKCAKCGKPAIGIYNTVPLCKCHKGTL